MITFWEFGCTTFDDEPACKLDLDCPEDAGAGKIFAGDLTEVFGTIVNFAG